MKKYILMHKVLLTTALVFGTIFSVGSTLLALILKDVIDVSISRDMDRFVSMAVQTAVYLLVLGVCYGLYSTFSKKFICKVTKALRGDAFEGIFKKNISDFKSVNSADYLSALTNLHSKKAGWLFKKAIWSHGSRQRLFIWNLR